MRPVRHGEVEIRGSEKGQGLVEKWVVTAGPGGGEMALPDLRVERLTLEPS